MRSRIAAFVVAAICCISCVEINPELGIEYLREDQKLHLCVTEVPLTEIYELPSDSLSGYSQTRMVVGSLDDGDGFGRTDRTSILSLVPLYIEDTMDIKTFLDSQDVKIKRFHFSTEVDSVSVADASQEIIFQNVNVNPLKERVIAQRDNDCNDVAGNIKIDKSKSLVKGTPVLDGKDSLTFDFTDEYANLFLHNLDKELMKDFDAYMNTFPGFAISTDKVRGKGGRLNFLNHQFDFDSDYGIIGNFAALTLNYTAHKLNEDTGEIETIPNTDTTFCFYFAATDFYDIDSLLTNSGKGNYPQYALNLSYHQSRPKAGMAGDKIYVEGGGGLKPVIRGRWLREQARSIVIDSVAAWYGKTPGEVTAKELAKVTINKASLIMPYKFEPAMFDEMYKYTVRLSPNLRTHYQDSAKVDGEIKYFSNVMYSNLSDSSDETVNVGTIDRSNTNYSPDITYHITKLLAMTDEEIASSEKMAKGEYDVWLMPMAWEVINVVNAADEEASEYYQYLAYQNYYNSMYGYGSSYGSAYTNYYSYMMAAMNAAGTTTTTSTIITLDTSRYYRTVLNGPSYTGTRPTLKLTFSIPNIE